MAKWEESKCWLKRFQKNRACLKWVEPVDQIATSLVPGRGAVEALMGDLRQVLAWGWGEGGWQAQNGNQKGAGTDTLSLWFCWHFDVSPEIGQEGRAEARPGHQWGLKQQDVRRSRE